MVGKLYTPAAVGWLAEIEVERSLDDLANSASVTSNILPDFEVLESKVASGGRKTSTRKLQKAKHENRRDS